MLDGIDFSDLRKKISRQAKTFYQHCQDQSPDHRFYGLAICVDGDITSLYCQANSDESLEHEGDRFFINDWPFTDNSAAEANQSLGALWKQFHASTGGSDQDRREMRKRCLETIVNGLRDFRREANLSPDFGLFVYDPDPAAPDEALQIAKFLNSAKTYAAFADPDNGFPFA